MEGLYKVDNIQGKGLGWIALKDIKVGTLICKEKPQFVYKEPFELWNLMEAFTSMSKNDQGRRNRFSLGGARIIRKMTFCEFSKILLYKSSILGGAQAPPAPPVPRPLGI